MEKQVLKHLGIIMDGNRRWARAEGLPTLEGHRRGYDKVKDVGEWCMDRGVEVFTVYAFSTENWKRTEEEVGYLMDLILRAFTKEVDEFMRRDIRVRMIGRREGLSKKILHAADAIWERTKENKRGLLQLAINYGGHAEIVDATRAIVQEGVSEDKITEELFGQHMYASDVSPPEMIIRTSGEQRLSGFLTWQSVYSELYFTDVHWPAFSEADLDTAFDWFAKRGRRFGK
jgi:undecaprenyl diphosphate synthase